MGTVRVLPLLAFAALCLFGLKAAGLFLSGGYVLSGAAPASAQDTKTVAGQSAGSGPAAGAEQKTDAAQGGAAPAESGGQPGEDEAGVTQSEKAVLEGLSNRREALDERARKLEMRENLLKAAEKRVQARIAELKKIEARIEGTMQEREDRRAAQYTKLVEMYSNMKPGDAANIFNRLDLQTLTGMAGQMKPRIMSAILAEMEPAAAERLTLEIANKRLYEDKAGSKLPKIQNQDAE